ncbi:hypothetical protein [Laspinema olomoucense]|nr:MULTISPECIES: hypothetical protein [unclassified Laspinema]
MAITLVENTYRCFLTSVLSVTAIVALRSQAIAVIHWRCFIT